MCMNKGKKSSGVCLSQRAIHLMGLALIIVGMLVIIAFVPLRYWMALLGMILLAAGVALVALF